MTSPNYAGWPTVEDVRARLESAGIALRGRDGTGADERRIAAAIAEITAEVGRRTLRQFIADTAGQPTVRYYDGNGTPQMETDEFVELAGVAAIGLNDDPGYPLANVTAIVEQGKPMTAITRSRGGLPAFQAAGLYQPLPAIFPAGRQNIAVTAQFGYAATVPPDLWSHVCGEIARRVAAEAIYQAGGRLVSQKAGDEAQAFTLADLDALGWQAVYERDMTRAYKRPAGRRARGLRAGMV